MTVYHILVALANLIPPPNSESNQTSPRFHSLLTPRRLAPRHFSRQLKDSPPLEIRVSFSKLSYSILTCLGVTSFYKTSLKHRINRYFTPLFSNGDKSPLAIREHPQGLKAFF